MAIFLFLDIYFVICEFRYIFKTPKKDAESGCITKLHFFFFGFCTHHEFLVKWVINRLEVTPVLFNIIHYFILIFYACFSSIAIICPSDQKKYLYNQPLDIQVHMKFLKKRFRRIAMYSVGYLSRLYIGSLFLNAKLYSPHKWY